MFLSIRGGIVFRRETLIQTKIHNEKAVAGFLYRLVAGSADLAGVRRFRQRL